MSSSINRCKQCGLPFAKLTGNRKYCNKCRRSGIIYYVKKEPFKVICSICSTDFETTLSKQLYCSPVCRSKADKRTGAFVTRFCAYCGEEFLTTDTKKKYCDEYCYTTNKNREARNARTAKRSAIS